MGKLTIGSFSSLVGSLSLDFAVKLSEAAIQKGHKVDLWISGNATMLSKKGQKAFKDYSPCKKSSGTRRHRQFPDNRLRGVCRGQRL